MHPVDEPVARFLCLNSECRAPITRRNQFWCSAACEQAVRRQPHRRYRPAR